MVRIIKLIVEEDEKDLRIILININIYDKFDIIGSKKLPVDTMNFKHNF